MRSSARYARSPMPTDPAELQRMADAAWLAVAPTVWRLEALRAHVARYALQCPACRQRGEHASGCRLMAP